MWFLVARLFDVSAILALKFIFVSLLNICVPINLLVPASFLSTSSIFYSRFSLFESIAITLLTNLSYIYFLATSLFTTLLSLFKSIETVSNSSISNLPTSGFEAKSVVLAKCDVPTPVAFYVRHCWITVRT